MTKVIRVAVLAVTLVPLLVLSSGCAALSEQERNTLVGTVGGSLAGAAIGAAVGGAQGGIIGAAGGAVGGAIVGASAPTYPPYGGTIVIRNPEPLLRKRLVAQLTLFFADDLKQPFLAVLKERGWTLEPGYDRADLVRFNIHRTQEKKILLEVTHPNKGTIPYFANTLEEFSDISRRALDDIWKE